MSLCPVKEAVWFSYYGPIREMEVSNSLESAITNSLHDEGHTMPSIPIRTQIAENIAVPVGLCTPSFTEEDGSLVVHFAAGIPGKVTWTSHSQKMSSDFNENMAAQFKISLMDKMPATLQFDFNVDQGVSARIFTLNFHGTSIPTVVSDKIICDGVEFTISKVYLGQETTLSGDGDFSEGMCIICCSEPATIISFPCRHCCMCRECSEQFASISNHCPVCRAIVTELIDYQPCEAP